MATDGRVGPGPAGGPKEGDIDIVGEKLALQARPSEVQPLSQDAVLAEGELEQALVTGREVDGEPEQVLSAVVVEVGDPEQSDVRVLGGANSPLAGQDEVLAGPIEVHRQVDANHAPSIGPMPWSQLPRIAATLFRGLAGYRLGQGRGA